MALNSSLLPNRSRIIKTFDNVKGILDAWSFKNLFFTFLFIRVRFPAEFKKYVEEEVPKLRESDKDVKREVEGFIRRIDPDLFGLKELADIEGTFKGLTDGEASDKLLYILEQINGLDLTKEQDFGDLYEYLVDQCGQRAGMSGGEFYTPICLTELIFQIVNKWIVPWRRKETTVYDPTGGTGSLLLKMNKLEKTKAILHMQEINHRSLQFAKLNILAHGINDFCLELGDTLINDKFKDKAFNVVVANYPYGIRWEPKKADPNRFIHGLAPEGKADYAFIQHMINKLDYNGVCVTLCFPGILFREGEEGKIRRSIIKSGLIRAVVDLPPNLFYGTTISPSLLVLTRPRFHNYPNDEIMFIDATKAFKKQPKQNTMRARDIEHISNLISHGVTPGIHERPPEGSAIRYRLIHRDKVLHPDEGNGCLCPRTYVPTYEGCNDIAYIPGEESRERTLKVLKFLKTFMDLERAGFRLFKETSEEFQEFSRVMEESVKMLFDKYLSEK